MLSDKTSATITAIRADLVYASTVVRAGIVETLVQVQLTILSLETFATIAAVATVIIEACASVQTRIVPAFIDIYFAIRTLVTKEKKRNLQSLIIKL